MERVQFPIRLCFGITANKSQGQTYKRVGINLSKAEMFSHGQLYVALSRVGSAKAVSIFKPKGHPNPDHMHNVVYPEVLSNSKPDFELPIPNDSLDNISFTDLLNERMGGDYEEDEQNVPFEPVLSTPHFVDLEVPENLDMEGYDAIKSQFIENPLDPLHLDDKHAVEEVEEFVNARLESLGYERSKSQPNTPGDGNCFIHGILDQLRYDQWRKANIGVKDFRKIIVSYSDDHPELVTEYGLPEDWYETMQQDGVHCDHYFQSLTADYLQRDIILVSALPQDGHDERGEIVIESKTKGENNRTLGPLYLLYYHEGSFANGHFQSIRPSE